jgi:hypothetical protein
MLGAVLARGMLVRFAMADLIALPLERPGPSRPRYELTDQPRFGRYVLCERVPCGNDDECHVATLDEATGGYQPALFLRRFPAQRPDKPLLERIRRVAVLTSRGLEQIFELGRIDGRVFVVSELIEGVGLDQLDARLVARGQRLPWDVALALLFDATDRIGQLRAAGALHGGVTPARLRLRVADTGTLVLCHGMPAAEATWPQVLFAVVRPILRLAATAPERALLDGVLDDDGCTGALAVASDAVVLRHPELDPVLPALFQALLDDAPPVRERMRERLADRLDATAVRALWAIVRDPA